MAPSPKKKNGFMWFVDDFRRKEQAVGKNYGNINDLINAASPVWNNMSVSEKSRYNAKAKGEKGANVKLTTMGVSCSEIHKKENEAELKKQEEIKYIEMLVKTLNEENRLKDYLFPIVHTNVHCVTNSLQYITCEIAVGIFSLSTGVNLTYHDLIYNDIPIGYSSDAIENSKIFGINTNKASYKVDTMLVFSKLQDLLTKDCSQRLTSNQLPPLFAMPGDIPHISGFLANLCDSAMLPDIQFQVYDVSRLFFSIKNVLAENKQVEGFPVPSIASQELLKDTFAFSRGLACELVHENTDLYMMCSLSKVKRVCYVICDYCCMHADLPLVRGRHIPNDVHPLGASMRASSIYSGMKSLSICSDSRSAGSSSTSDMRNPIAAQLAPVPNTSYWKKPTNPENNMVSDKEFPSLGGSSSRRRK